MAYKVLIVDDEADVRELIRATLETDSEDYVLTEAVDGEEALKKVKGEKPNLIILDILMPGLDGYEVCKKLRADESLKDIPIIVLTVKTDLESRENGFKSGADLYLTKPFDPEELRSLVKGVLSGVIPTRKRE